MTDHPAPLDDDVLPTGAADALLSEPTEVRPRRRRWWLPVLVVLAVLAAAIGGVAVLREDDRYPSSWDPRVADLVRFVERERGLDFKHPVDVEFLAEDDFKELVRTDEDELTDEDREELEDSAAFLRALGLIDADLDLFESVNDLQGDSTLAFYDDDAEEVKVRGTVLTPAIRSTLVHELTHVLQDQHFDLGRRFDMEDGEAAAFEALVEGDANRIATAYEGTLSDEELDELAEDVSQDIEELDADRFPAVLNAIFGAPYALGEPLAMIIVEAEGRRGLDRAFRKPPTSEEAMLDPLGFVDGDVPEEVEELEVGAGQESFDDGVFGAFGLYVVLAHRLDQRQALAVASGWGGDRYVAYREAGRVCVRVEIEGEDAEATSGLRSGLSAWAAAMPAGMATVTASGGRVVLVSCELPAGSPAPPVVDVDDLLALPATRVAIAASMLAAGAEVPFARCFTNGAIEVLTLDQLQADELDAAANRALETLALRCRSGG